MNEERQARLLAEWLDGSAEQLAPEGIDVDVLEAIYVMQPDRAPAPRVTLEEILAPTLLAASTPAPPPRSVPLSTAELAAALAEDDSEDEGATEMFRRPTVEDEYSEGPVTDDLDGPTTDPDGPVTDPDMSSDGPPTDVDLHLDVPLADTQTEEEITATSIVALEPIREPLTDPGLDAFDEDVTQAFGIGERPTAPEPNRAPPVMNVDDDLTPQNPLEAAFGAPQEAAFGAATEPTATEPTATAAPRRTAKVIQFTPGKKPRSAPPLAPPQAERLPSEFPAIDEDEPPPEASSEAPLAAPEVAITTTGGEVVDLAPRRKWWRYAAGSGGLLAAAAALLITVGTPMLSMNEAGPPASQSSDLSAMLADESAPAAAPAAEPAEPALAKSSAGPTPTGRGDMAIPADDAPSAGFGADGSMVGGAAGGASAGDAAGLDAVADLDDMDDMEEPEEEEEALYEDERKAEAASAAPVASRAPRSAAADKDAEADEDEAVDIAALRAAAQPADYDDKWYLAADIDPEVAQRISQALSEVGTYTRFEEYAGAATACEPLIAEADVRVGQDFAYRAANYALQAGDTSRALNLIGQGLSRSSANTFFLSALHYLQGRILESQGDEAGAARSYEAAAALNEARR